MKRITFLLPFLSSFLSFAQPQNCSMDWTYRIAAESGMKLRVSPLVGSEVITYVMFDSIVQSCSTSYGEATFEGIDGDWRYVQYKDKRGYMFDGFLTLLTPVDTVADTVSLPMDSTLSEVVPTDSVVALDSSIIEEPKWTWERTERHNIPATGRLDQQQIQDLASALRRTDLRMDSLIGFLHQLPTKGSQDSLIAWVGAGMPEVKSSTPSTTPSTTPAQNEEQDHPAGPAGIRMQLATEAYNYCGDIGAIDPSMNWYGVFINEAAGNFRIQRVDIEILVSKSKLSNQMEFDIRNSTDESSYFLFGINRRLDTIKPFQLNPDRFAIAPAQLYPGQQLEAYANYSRPSAANVFISATGRVVEVGACPVIEDYALRINTQVDNREIRQDITPLFETLGECGMPEMYWFGDINGDGYPELVYVSAEENKNQFTLLMSDKELSTGLYVRAATWTLERCD